MNSKSLHLPADIGAAIVDLDGTMVDTLGDFVAVLGAVLGDLKLAPVSREFVEHTVGKGSEHLIRSTLAHAGADPDLYEEAWRLYRDRYLAINGDHSSVYPGVVDGLQRLTARGWKLACLTNKPGDFAPRSAAQEGAGRLFQRRLRRRCVRTQEARPAAAAQDLRGARLAPGAHLDDRRLQQRRPCRTRRRLSGGAGELRLQPRRTSGSAVDADGVIDRLDQL